MKIRSVKPEDLQEIQTLFIDTVSTICINDYNAEQINAWISSAKNTQRWSDALLKQFFLIAEKDNQIVGYSSLENGNYIDFLYIHKDYQRQGIAQRLLLALEEQAKKIGVRMLSSDVSKTARPFFERNGFKLVSENKNLIDGIEIINYKMTKVL